MTKLVSSELRCLFKTLCLVLGKVLIGVTPWFLNLINRSLNIVDNYLPVRGPRNWSPEPGRDVNTLLV